MEKNITKFSSRARVMCRQSDPSQPMHFLSRRYESDRPMSKCFICRRRKHRSKYHLHCDPCNYDIHKNCYFLPVCRMSDLTKPHTLHKRYHDFSSCVTCGSNGLDAAASYYRCATCRLSFHKVCHLYPPVIRHPFHSLHHLKLTFSPESSYSDLNELPTSWRHEPSDSETELDSSKSNDDAAAASITDVRCKCCQMHLQEAYYHCSICNFSLNLTCTRNPPPLTISNPKSHEHSLTIFPRRTPSPCDACGLSLGNTKDLVYACLPCNYILHRTCIYLPRVIKITRHLHRLSHSSSLPSGLYPCGVCRLAIDVTYGQFSCHKGCHYAVHSKCAVEGRVWDGRDLQGVPEEVDEDVVQPFLRIDDETIQHFSHGHPLRFHESNDFCDEKKLCEACVIPILVSESLYSCVEESCPFFLHEACASLPRKKEHPLHRHSLTLHPVTPEPFEVLMTSGGRESCSEYIKGMFICNGCGQLGNGFVYRCGEEDCKFQLDTRCASLPDPVIHGSHPHELFFNLTKGECMRCKSTHCSPYSLECMECKSFLGLKCATLPSTRHYKHDMHPLTLCYGEEDVTRRSHHYWCEICETKLDAKLWFYACDDYCGVTVHVSCLLGKQIIVKPASFELFGILISILHNNHHTRAICYECDHRCVEPFLLKIINYYLCSFVCLTRICDVENYHCIWKNLE